MEHSNSSTPIQCTMGCGFFGNPANSGMCSKCARDVAAKDQQETVSAPPVPATTIFRTPPKETGPSTDLEMSVETATPTPKVESPVSATVEVTDTSSSTTVHPPTAATDEVIKKKKKKKKATGYKAMMKEIKGEKKTIEEERTAQKEKIQHSLGGGTFSKLDKI